MNHTVWCIIPESLLKLCQIGRSSKVRFHLKAYLKLRIFHDFNVTMAYHNFSADMSHLVYHLDMFHGAKLENEFEKSYQSIRKIYENKFIWEEKMKNTCTNTLSFVPSIRTRLAFEVWHWRTGVSNSLNDHIGICLSY